MESINRKVAVIAVIMAVFTTFFIYMYIKKATVRPETIQYVNVYVAAKTLLARSTIADSDIKQVKIAKEYLNSEAVLDKKDIVGKRIKDRIIEGEQILKDRLVEDNKLSLAYSIPDGMRAVSINVDEQSIVGNLIRPGDYVDILASFEKEEVEDKTSKTVYPRTTKTIIQNVQVLAMGQDQVIEADKKPDLPKTITLAVTPQDAEKLVYVSEYAALRLALRPANDSKLENTDGIVRSDMLTDKGKLVLPK